MEQDKDSFSERFKFYFFGNTISPFSLLITGAIIALTGFIFLDSDLGNKGVYLLSFAFFLSLFSALFNTKIHKKKVRK